MPGFLIDGHIQWTIIDLSMEPPRKWTCTSLLKASKAIEIAILRNELICRIATLGGRIQDFHPQISFRSSSGAIH